jgi:aldose 1-epimerase
MKPSVAELDNKISTALSPLLLKNEYGLAVDVLPFGATISSILLDDQQLILFYENTNSYPSDQYYIGATAGRYANRISNGKFNLDGKEYSLNKNQEKHCLHGGERGFSKAVWQVLSHQNDSLTLYYCSVDGEQGFPGELEVWQTITLKKRAIHIDYQAISNKNTVLNLTNHCYFNLDSEDDLVNNHRLQVFSERFLPIDNEAIPTGEIRSVSGGCFDFQQGKQVNQVLFCDDKQVQLANGIDHCFVFDNEQNEMQLQAILTSSKSNRTLSVYSSQLGLQVYTGNFLSTPFKPNQGICLEAQNWPDAPNKENFPSALLKAGEKYQQSIIYSFN